MLDAAEQVVACDGAASPTIDAVAQQAGISKASLRYDHKSKQALIDAVVQRAVALDSAHHATVHRNSDLCPVGSFEAVEAKKGVLSDESRAAALSLCAALTQDAGLHRTIQANQRDVIASILSDSTNPRGALLAYLALEGLKQLECLDSHHWPADERTRLLEEIGRLIDRTPSDTGVVA
ncbi:TetR/AcrR family transcriptional regulator [Rubellimicrobium roseum]|uniref:TetR/AcrR family transcriptional regulator n=1 Tax=Rubellimicrobium roseum TaxID=687525 RepID=UPI001C3F388C|nr:TetR/AcrR family transcriptional regulator [Rubellimicrobium roseum]